MGGANSDVSLNGVLVWGNLHLAEFGEERRAPEACNPVGLREEVVRCEVVPVAPSVDGLQLAVQGGEEDHELALRDLWKRRRANMETLTVYQCFRCLSFFFCISVALRLSISPPYNDLPLGYSSLLFL